MGTNFYGRKFLQPDQETYPEDKIHLGKRSSGWNFLAQWNDGKYNTTKQEYLDFAKDLEIFAEYGNLIKFEEFKGMVNNWQGKTHKCVENTFFDEKAELEFSAGDWF